MKKLLYTLSLVLVLTILTSQVSIVFASDILYVDAAIAKYESLESYFASDLAESAKCTRISMDESNGGIQLITECNGDNLKFYGTLYHLPDLQWNENDIIAGEFKDNGKYEIILFCISKTELEKGCILIKDSGSGCIWEISFAVTEDMYDILHQYADKNTKELQYKALNTRSGDSDLAKMYVLWLLNPEKQELYSTTAQSTMHFDSLNTNSGYYLPMTDFVTFCSTLHSQGTNTASSIMHNVFMQTGWVLDKRSDYFYVMHGVQNTANERLISITECTIENDGPDGGYITGAVHVIASCTFSYNTSTRVASLLYYNTGVKMENAAVAVELLGGTTNFKYAMKAYQLDGSMALKNVLLSTSSNLTVASNIWSYLQQSSSASDNVDLGSDATQNSIYHGLVRTVASQCKSNHYLWSAGNYISIRGQYNTSKTYQNHRVDFQFDARSLL